MLKVTSIGLIFYIEDMIQNLSYSIPDSHFDSHFYKLGKYQLEIAKGLLYSKYTIIIDMTKLKIFKPKSKEINPMLENLNAALQYEIQDNPVEVIQSLADEYINNNFDEIDIIEG